MSTSLDKQCEHFYPLISIIFPYQVFFNKTEIILEMWFYLYTHLIGTLETTKLRSPKHFLSICYS